MQGEHAPHPGTMSPLRIEALADGVFAIVMTLLVFDIRLPEVAPGELSAALVVLLPKFVSYVVSFVLLGIYWIGHRAQFNYIRRADQNLHWLNILFLSFAAFVPFASGIIGRYPDRWLAITLYGLNLSAIGVSLYWHWIYAVRHPELVQGVTPGAVRYGIQRCLLAPIGYLGAIAVGLIDTRLSLVLYALIPIAYIVPAIQRRWLRWALGG